MRGLVGAWVEGEGEFQFSSALFVYPMYCILCLQVKTTGSILQGRRHAAQHTGHDTTVAATETYAVLAPALSPSPPTTATFHHGAREATRLSEETLVTAGAWAARAAGLTSSSLFPPPVSIHAGSATRLVSPADPYRGTVIIHQPIPTPPRVPRPVPCHWLILTTALS